MASFLLASASSISSAKRLIWSENRIIYTLKHGILLAKEEKPSFFIVFAFFESDEVLKTMR
jgi:hypothetical protein